jgi:hypothetical protein
VRPGEIANFWNTARAVPPDDEIRYARKEQLAKVTDRGGIERTWT